MDLALLKNKEERMAPISVSSTVLPLTVDSKGDFQYDVVARVGHSANRIVYTRYSDTNPRPTTGSETYPRPSSSEIHATTEKTRLALEAIVQRRIGASQPKNVASTVQSVSVVQYKPASDYYSVGREKPTQRLVRIVEQKMDPLDPLGFKHKKIPRGPSSPPVPVLHSPPRKATAEEQKAWVIPPSISNWKNPKGYTIPLDKRLACDGRGLQETVVNERFASFAESLYIAETHAREEVSKRNELERQMAEQERLEKEAHLRLLAQKAREDRLNLQNVLEGDSSLQEREGIRKDRMREREREYRLSRVSKRDIGERISLDTAQTSRSSESMFDQRLFNQSEGFSSGFNPSDESYDLYDKALFSGSTANVIYRPSVEHETGEDDSMDNAKERPVGLGAKGIETKPRSGPVQFERGGVIADAKVSTSPKRTSSSASDPFGLDVFLQAAKKGRPQAD